MQWLFPVHTSEAGRDSGSTAGPGESRAPGEPDSGRAGPRGNRTPGELGPGRAGSRESQAPGELALAFRTELALLTLRVVVRLPESEMGTSLDVNCLLASHIGPTPVPWQRLPLE